MEKKLNKKIYIERYGLLDELAYSAGGYVIEPVNYNIDMKKIRDLRKISKKSKYNYEILLEKS